MKKRLLLFLIPVFVLLLLCLPPWQLAGHYWQFTPKKYQSELRQIQGQCKQLAKRKDFNHTGNQFVKVIKKQIFPYWYGTFWSFNGITQNPGRGSIACGYFVTTVLRDAGIDLNRSKLAQLPSEQMIKKLVASEHIQAFSNIEIHDFVQQIKRSGKGLYVVGLDTHTGFILYDESGIRFIHASGGFPCCVINEKAEDSRTLRKSAFHIIGKLNADKNLMRNWLN
ncbi:MAG: hypothetical protein H7Y04_01215 [Verrucomicrobia bacterium]|nr:hypothetical protein [Cytophagales bacterium]